MSAVVRSLADGLRCQRCATRFPTGWLFEGCPACADGPWAANLAVEYESAGAKEAWRHLSGRGVWRYAAFLPVANAGARISLGEGATPLLPLNVAPWRAAWVKNETLNPTWSYKDRQCSVAVSKAREGNASVIAASSMGNHGASAAAYAARAGLQAVVLTREDVDPNTVAFMEVYGATVIRTTRRGRWALLAYGVREFGWYSVSTYTQAPTGNPYGTEGYKTIAFEIFEQLGRVPAVVVVPTSYGEGLSGIWAGFRQLAAIGVGKSLPRMVAAEPAGGAPLAFALDHGLNRVVEVPCYDTIATSIAATTAADSALLALRQSGGASVRVPDVDTLEAQRELAASGLFLEPSGAAALAALKALPARCSDIDPGRDLAVMIGTGGGLRQVQLLLGRLPEGPAITPEGAALREVLSPDLIRRNR